jgi:hypothetical protein
MISMLSFRRALVAAGLALALAAAPAAQGTTGVAGVNNYTVNGLTPGSSSCTLLFPVPAGPVVLNVNTAPSAPVVFLFNVNCPCSPCFFPWAPATCPMPPTTTCPTTNQAYELNSTFATCIFLSAGTTANSSGNATITVVVPPTIRFSTQAVLIHPCYAGLVFSQAYNVSVP